MPDREKVIGHLNDCMEASRRDNTWVFVRKDIVEDALALLKEQQEYIEYWSAKYDEFGKAYMNVRDERDALLKEQEAVKPVLDKQTGRMWLCGKCGSYVGFEDNDPYDPNEFDKYCRECGRPVLLEGR